MPEPRVDGRSQGAGCEGEGACLGTHWREDSDKREKPDQILSGQDFGEDDEGEQEGGSGTKGWLAQERRVVRKTDAAMAANCKREAGGGEGGGKRGNKVERGVGIVVGDGNTSGAGVEHQQG